MWDAADPATQRESEVRKKRLHFGLVFQNFNLFPQYTALQNVMLAGELLAKERPDYKANKKAIHAQLEQQAKELLAQMGLSERAGHYPHQLSGAAAAGAAGANRQRNAGDPRYGDSHSALQWGKQQVWSAQVALACREQAPQAGAPVCVSSATVHWSPAAPAARCRSGSPARCAAGRCVFPPTAGAIFARSERRAYVKCPEASAGV